MDSTLSSMLVLLAAIPIFYKAWKLIEKKSNNDEINEAIFPRGQHQQFHSQLFQSMPLKDDTAYRASEILQHLFAEAKSSIDIAVYHISAASLLPPLIEAKKRGVDVRVIIDHSSFGLGAVNGCVNRLRNAGIEVNVFHSNIMMHMKMCLIDVPRKGILARTHRGSSRLPANGLTVTGSMNWSREAITTNQEMYVVTSNRNICEVSKSEFEAMWRKSEM